MTGLSGPEGVFQELIGQTPRGMGVVGGAIIARVFVIPRPPKAFALSNICSEISYVPIR
jgi:hypothetical protein